MTRIVKCGPDPAVMGALSCVENSVAVTGVDAVLAERGARYGKFRDHAALSQKLKATLMMHDPNHADNFIDIAGYATLVANRLEGKIV